METSLNNLTEVDLAEITKLSQLFFSPRAVAIILGYEQDAFAKACRLSRNPVYNAYHGGKLGKEMLLRKSVIDLAIKGSSPAQTAALGFVDNVNAQLLER